MFIFLLSTLTVLSNSPYISFSLLTNIFHVVRGMSCCIPLYQHRLQLLRQKAAFILFFLGDFCKRVGFICIVCQYGWVLLFLNSGLHHGMMEWQLFSKCNWLLQFSACHSDWQVQPDKSVLGWFPVVSCTSPTVWSQMLKQNTAIFKMFFFFFFIRLGDGFMYNCSCKSILLGLESLVFLYARVILLFGSSGKDASLGAFLATPLWSSKLWSCSSELWGFLCGMGCLPLFPAG